MRTILVLCGVVFTMVLTSLMLSCHKKVVISDNTVDFETISMVNVYHINNDSTLPSCNLRINYIYPVSYGDSNILSEIKNVFLTSFFNESYKGMEVKDALEKYKNIYVANYKEDVEVFYKERRNAYDMENSDSYFSYYENLYNDIKYNRADIMSFQVVQNNNKGGNTSFKQYANYVMDLKTAKILKEEDLFASGYEKVLNAAFIDKLLKKNKVGNIQDLEDLGYFGIEEIAPNNNFLVDGKGVTYIFNRGEYSVLQLEEINIFLPFEEIKSILKEGSPISVLYKNE
ncbi:MAG: DUF3298 domain-containing protein [Dysgonomonas sp.]